MERRVKSIFNSRYSRDFDHFRRQIRHRIRLPHLNFSQKRIKANERRIFRLEALHSLFRRAIKSLRWAGFLCRPSCRRKWDGYSSSNCFNTLQCNWNNESRTSENQLGGTAGVLFECYIWRIDLLSSVMTKLQVLHIKCLILLAARSPLWTRSGNNTKRYIVSDNSQLVD